MRVLVCDDHALMVSILAEHLRAEGHETVATESPEQAVEVQRAAPVDVCVLDLIFRNSALDGAQAVERLLEISAHTRVLLLTSQPSSPVARRAVAAGAHALLDKSRPLSVVSEAVRRLGRGQPYVPSQLRQSSELLQEELSARELDVLGLLVRGCSTAQIGERLGISVHTVRKHVQRLLDKLGASTRLEAVTIALRRGLVAPQPPLPTAAADATAAIAAR